MNLYWCIFRGQSDFIPLEIVYFFELDAACRRSVISFSCSLKNYFNLSKLRTLFTEFCLRHGKFVNLSGGIIPFVLTLQHGQLKTGWGRGKSGSSGTRQCGFQFSFFVAAWVAPSLLYQSQPHKVVIRIQWDHKCKVLRVSGTQ